MPGMPGIPGIPPKPPMPPMPPMPPLPIMPIAAYIFYGVIIFLNISGFDNIVLISGFEFTI
jgi:hypothetical protein